MRRKFTILVLGMIISVAMAAVAMAVPTQITVRVKAKDAKFVGTSMGGALITVRNARTGEMLTKGYTEGSTGNTALIMTTPMSRGSRISDDHSAAFTATIDIDRPELVEVTAYGPQANLQSANRVSATQWVVPGKDLSGGDAWLMELPGFVVDVLAPPAHSVFSGTPQAVTISANVVMMCGCPITPGGLWNADGYEVAALLTKDGKPAGVLPLSYAGSTSQFSAVWNITEPGTYQATVYAYDAANGNTGVDSTTFMVR